MTKSSRSFFDVDKFINNSLCIVKVVFQRMALKPACQEQKRATLALCAWTGVTMMPPTLSTQSDSTLKGSTNVNVWATL